MLYDIRTIQELLGPADVTTTMIDTHVLIGGRWGCGARRIGSDRAYSRALAGMRGFSLNRAAPHLLPPLGVSLMPARAVDDP